MPFVATSPVEGRAQSRAARRYCFGQSTPSPTGTPRSWAARSAQCGSRSIARDIRRGSGTSQGARGDIGRYQEWFEEVADVLRLARDEHAGRAPHLVGHCFGGGLALALALQRPERVRRLVLISSLGSRFHITPELEAVWGYRPSLDSMRSVTVKLGFDRRLMSEEALMERYRNSSSQADGYARMFPAPRQRWGAPSNRG